MLSVTFEEKREIESILDWVDGVLDKFYMERHEAIRDIEANVSGPYMKESVLPLLKAHE